MNMVSPSTKRLANSTARMAQDLSVAAPFVVLMRLSRMAWAGPAPSRTDQQEFTTMVTEKQAAALRSWQAMWMEAWRIQGALTMAWFNACAPWMFAHSHGGFDHFANLLANSPLAIAHKGLRPIHRRALSNAKRLARKP